MVQPKEITFEEAWSDLQEGVTKVIRIIEGGPEPPFECQQCIHLYTTVYNMSTQKIEYAEQFYAKYREVIEDYIKETVLPSLREKHDENMLRELVMRWKNLKSLVAWFTKIFKYIDRFFVIMRGVPSLRKFGFRCFYGLVMSSTATEAVIALIHREREGEQIDRILVKNVIDIYVENGMGTIDVYIKDFAIYMLRDTAAYYSCKASRWIQEHSCPDYMLKSEECLKRERERVTHYLHPKTEPILVEKIQKELLEEVAKQLLENEHSGLRALLRDAKMDDLSRMYKLYHPIPQGLEHVADLFKQHITEERNDLIKQVDDESTNQVVNELQDKYMVYVTECFQSHTLFHKALKETFEILRKDGGSEKLE